MIHMSYDFIETEQGEIGILATERGLFSLFLKDFDPEDLEKIIKQDNEENFVVKKDPEGLSEIFEQIRDYLEGKISSFDIDIDLGGATEFQQLVWEATRKIPYGETRTYGWLAQKIGKPKAFRAVGNALNANPIPIVIPCHRVVATSGLGGYGGGIEWKKFLLRLEGSLEEEGEEQNI